MSRSAASVPEATDLLCEACGYALNGLAAGARCPECGTPASESLVADGREPTEFELDPSPGSFIRTTRRVLTRPGQFYRTLLSRSDTPQAARFALLHRLIASLFFALAAAGHIVWLGQVTPVLRFAGLWLVPLVLGLIPAIFLLMQGVTRLATWLSTLEAAYWGMRLPYPVVRRAFHFHSAHYLPVSLLASCIVWGHHLLISTRRFTIDWTQPYLYTLSGFVVLAAGYLFLMYWIAMTKLRYANR
jgi:uncharacterized membrane protein